jgi:thiol-disulfide isomerase/thioredoxin
MLGSAGLGQVRPPSDAPTLSLGDPAPPVRVAKWLKGHPIESFEKGRVYFVEFWATWCEPCKAGMPHLSELARKYEGRMSVTGIDVLERAGVSLEKVEKFVTDQGARMDYNVAADTAEGTMNATWLKASAHRGIPLSFIIDQDGKVAWIGYPIGRFAQLEAVIDKVLARTWDTAADAKALKEKNALSQVDGTDVVNRLNPFMRSKNYAGALVEIDKIVAEHPGLKYRAKTGHFTFYSLMMTDPARAASYGKAWVAAADDPQLPDAVPYSDIADSVLYRGASATLPKELNELAADCYQGDMDTYPWSMDGPKTYDSIALLQSRAGNKAKALAAEQKAIALAKAFPDFSPDRLAKLESNLAAYQ